MKARLLRKLLNDTKYTISNNDDYIAIGSPLCHDLISVDKKTLRVKYALDTFHEGRKAIKHEELKFIWDKLHALISTGQIQEIMEGKDVIENPLPVFTIRDGMLVESVTDQYGWPNTDDEGYCMYENTYFDDKEEALEHGVNEYSHAVRGMYLTVHQKEEELSKARGRLNEYQKSLRNLCDQLNNLKKDQ